MRSLLERHKAFLMVAAIVAAFALLAVGCGSSNKNKSTSAAPAPAATTPTTTTPSSKGKTYTVGIDIPFHPIFDYVQAKSKEYFGPKGYTVKFKVLDATTQVPSFGKGDLDVMTTPPSFIPRVTQQYGLQVAEFFPLARWTIGPQILVSVNSPYKTLADLKGKKLAIAPLKSRFGSEEAAIEADTGQNIRQYFKLQETDAAAQQLAQGRVDAAWIEAPSTYPLLQSKKFKAIYSVHDAFQKAFGDPAVVNGGYIARTDFIQNNPEFIKDLVAATQDAWNKYNANADAVNKVAAKISGIPAAQLKVVGQVLDLNGIPQAQRAITQQDVDTWSKIFPLLVKSGFIKQAPADPSKLFVVTGG
jgi:ABC-type nitrate/sulfonate/bicarbonate transport system substrate-binding protein